MLLRFNAPVRSRAEWMGSLVGLVVEPEQRILLRLVVEEPQASPLVRVSVPFGSVESAEGESVTLSLKPAEFKALPVIDRSGAERPRKRVPGARGREEGNESHLSSRTRVECRDGEVGLMTYLQVDARTGDLQAFTFPFGMPLTREVLVPFDHVQRLADDRLQLALDMDDLAEFATLRR